MRHSTEKAINRNRPRNNRDDEIGGQELYNIYYKYCKYVQNLKENISIMKIAGRYKIMKCLETEKKILRHFMQMETAKTGVAILISDKIEFKAKSIAKDKRKALYSYKGINTRKESNKTILWKVA